jgi:hypothetical protein
MAQTTRVFRIFISSTFGDFQAERNKLQEVVWPYLRKLCESQGARFQAVDLRWGVSEEASLDRQTMAICLAEIERCRRVSKRPNFLILLGDRYGSRLLPTTIPAGEFEDICSKLPPAESDRLNEQYLRDNNAADVEYVLQPWRNTQVDSTATEQTGAEAEPERAGRAMFEQELRNALIAGVGRLPLGNYDRTRYFASATEQEILAGALNVDDAGEHVHCFFRSITNLDALVDDIVATKEAKAGKRARDFVDVVEEDSQIQRDIAARDDLEALKKRLETHLPQANRHTYDARWTGEGITSDHIAQLCEDVKTVIEHHINEEMAQWKSESTLDIEERFHQAFGDELRDQFQGRNALRRDIAGYLVESDAYPFVVHGVSGAGKSALIAQASEDAAVAAHRSRPGAIVITRYVGATPESSNTRALLQNLCQAISRNYGADESTIPSDEIDLASEFSKRLQLATAQQPLIIFVDGLDQLGNEQRLPNLNWLLSDLPAHVRVVVSILDGAAFRSLEGQLPPTRLVSLEALSRTDGETALNEWLAAARRKLQPHQRDEVLDRFAANGLPLYLRLAFERVRHWHSYPTSEETPLAADIPGIIQDLFGRLARPENHGPVLVSRGLGYLGAAKAGLSEDELVDVLSSDEVVLEDFRKHSPNSPYAKQLPMIIWSRLYFDLERYLPERATEGATTLTFYHRQLAEVVQRQYLSGDDGEARHQKLAEYFAWPEGEVDGRVAPNLRRLTELPYQQTMGKLWDEVLATLTNFNFMEQKIAHVGVIERTDALGVSTKTYSGVYQLQDDCDLALQLMP